MGTEYLLLTSHRFEVHIGSDTMGFRSISGLKLSASFEPLQVGGMNSSPVLLPVPVKEPGRLTLERGVSSLIDYGFYAPGSKLADEIQIHIINEKGESSVSYAVSSPVLEAVELAKLDAMDSTVLIETFTVIHSGISLIWKD